MTLIAPPLAQVSPEAVGFGLGLGFILLIALAILASLGLFVLWIWMLIDCAQAPHNPKNPQARLLWIIVMVFTGWLGAVLYYFLERRPRLANSSPGNPFTVPPRA